MRDPEDSRAGDDIASWVERIQHGIEVELNFERVFRYFHPRLIHYFSRRGFDASACEDLTQILFARVFRAIQGVENPSHFTKWLFEIAHNTYANEIRRLKTGKRLGLEVPLQEENEPESEDEESRHTAPALAAGTPSPHDEADRRAQVEALRRAFRTLPPKMRQCVLLRYLHGLKYREISEILGTKIDTVKAHLGAARVRLWERLGGEAEIVKKLSAEPDDSGDEDHRA